MNKDIGFTINLSFRAKTTLSTAINNTVIRQYTMEPVNIEIIPKTNIIRFKTL